MKAFLRKIAATVTRGAVRCSAWLGVIGLVWSVRKELVDLLKTIALQMTPKPELGAMPSSQHHCITERLLECLHREGRLSECPTCSMLSKICIIITNNESHRVGIGIHRGSHSTNTENLGKPMYLGESSSDAPQILERGYSLQELWERLGNRDRETTSIDRLNAVQEASFTGGAK